MNISSVSIYGSNNQNMQSATSFRGYIPVSSLKALVPEIKDEFIKQFGRKVCYSEETIDKNFLEQMKEKYKGILSPFIQYAKKLSPKTRVDFLTPITGRGIHHRIYFSNPLVYNDVSSKGKTNVFPEELDNEELDNKKYKPKEARKIWLKYLTEMSPEERDMAVFNDGVESYHDIDKAEMLVKYTEETPTLDESAKQKAKDILKERQQYDKKHIKAKLAIEKRLSIKENNDKFIDEFLASIQ